jgi:tetratricopeptide (TPR) repeat protein
MRSAMTVIVTASLVLFAQSAVSARQAGDSLRGMIKISDGNLPAAVRIRVQKAGITIQEGFPRENRFEFHNLAAGRYTIVAEAPGYVTAEQEINFPGEYPVLELLPQRQPVGPALAVPAWSLQIPDRARREFIAGKNKLLANNCAGALDHLKKAIRSYDGFGDAHRAMGECYVQMNRMEAAENEFKRALEQPHSAELHLLLGKIYAGQGKRDLLVRQLEFFVSEEKPGPLRDKALAAIEAR